MEDFRKYTRDNIVVEKVSDPIVETRTEEEIISDIMVETHIDTSREYKEPRTYLGIKNEWGEVATLCTPANISIIKGMAKSKKSFLQNMFAASSATNGSLQNKIISDLPEDKNQVIILDTEQSIWHTYKRADKISRLIGYDPDNLAVFSLRGMDGEVIKKLLNYIIEYFPNIGMIYIDQVADLAKSINSEEEAVSIVRWLEKISKDHDIHICCIVHQNRANGFSNGWLGSQLEKKSECVISVDKDEDDSNISHVRPSMSRSKDFDEFSIRIDSSGLPRVMSDDDYPSYIKKDSEI